MVRIRLLPIVIPLAIAVCACSSRRPASAPAAMPTAAMPSAALPQGQLKEVLVNSCYDCHSDRPASGWTAALAPTYWVSSARETLDFSQWQTYDTARRAQELKAIANAVERGAMPPGDYTVFRPSAKLTPDEKQLLTQWASAPAAMAAH